MARGPGLWPVPGWGYRYYGISGRNLNSGRAFLALPAGEVVSFSADAESGCSKVCSGNHQWPMTEVTQLLSDPDQGDPHAANRLLPLVYDELRKLAAQQMAQEEPGQMLQPTPSVH